MVDIEDDLNEKDYSFGDEYNDELEADIDDSEIEESGEDESLNDFEYDDIYGDKFEDDTEDANYTDDISEENDTDFEEFGA